MEALAVVGLTSSIVQFLDFSSKIASLFKSALKDTERAERNDLVDCQRLSRISGQLTQLTSVPADTPFGEEIKELAGKCHSLAVELYPKLQSLQIPYQAGKWKVVINVVKTLWSQKDMDNITQKLQQYNQQLSLLISAELRSQTFAQHEAVVSMLQTSSQDIGAKLDNLLTEFKADISNLTTRFDGLLLEQREVSRLSRDHAIQLDEVARNLEGQATQLEVSIRQQSCTGTDIQRSFEAQAGQLQTIFHGHRRLEDHLSSVQRDVRALINAHGGHGAENEQGGRIRADEDGISATFAQASTSPAAFTNDFLGFAENEIRHLFQLYQAQGQSHRRTFQQAETLYLQFLRRTIQDMTAEAAWRPGTLTPRNQVEIFKDDFGTVVLSLTSFHQWSCRHWSPGSHTSQLHMRAILTVIPSLVTASRGLEVRYERRFDARGFPQLKNDMSEVYVLIGPDYPTWGGVSLYTLLDQGPYILRPEVRDAAMASIRCTVHHFLKEGKIRWSDRDVEGRTLLHIAARTGLSGVCDDLIRLGGADITTPSCKGQMAFSFVVSALYNRFHADGAPENPFTLTDFETILELLWPGELDPDFFFVFTFPFQWLTIDEYRRVAQPYVRRWLRFILEKEYSTDWASRMLRCITRTVLQCKDDSIDRSTLTAVVHDILALYSRDQINCGDWIHEVCHGIIDGIQRDAPGDLLDEWIPEIFRSLVNYGINIHLVERVPLLSYLHYIVPELPVVMLSILTSEFGLDLDDYKEKFEKYRLSYESFTEEQEARRISNSKRRQQHQRRRDEMRRRREEDQRRSIEEDLFLVNEEQEGWHPALEAEFRRQEEVIRAEDKQRLEEDHRWDEENQWWKEEEQRRREVDLRQKAQDKALGILQKANDCCHGEDGEDDFEDDSEDNSEDDSEDDSGEDGEDDFEDDSEDDFEDDSEDE